MTARTLPPLVLTVPSRASFFSGIERHLRADLPPEYQRFRARSAFHLLKIDFGADKIHYEVGLDVTGGRLETALHFEDGPVSTSAYLSHFDRHLIEIKHALGWNIELERWTLSWGRLYLVHPLAPLDAAFTAESARRLAALIQAVQPIVDAAGIPADPQSGERRSKWSRPHR